MNTLFMSIIAIPEQMVKFPEMLSQVVKLYKKPNIKSPFIMAHINFRQTNNSCSSAPLSSAAPCARTFRCLKPPKFAMSRPLRSPLDNKKKKKLKPPPPSPSPDPSQPSASKSGNHHLTRRRWETLEQDCLANVFSKVGMESLVLSLPFVCKTWYATTVNPLCWESLSFPNFEPYPLFNALDDTNVEPRNYGAFYDKFVEENRIDRNRFSITMFIKLIVDRSKGNAYKLKLPQFCTEEALRYVADACPKVQFLQFSDDLVLFKHSRFLPEVIGKWKFLEHLRLGGNMENIMRQFEERGGEHLSRDFENTLSSLDSSNDTAGNRTLLETLVQVGAHCKEMQSLHICDASVGEAEASAIVEGIPNLLYLTLLQSNVEKDNLVKLLKGCKELWWFDVWNCEGFQENDEEILKLGSDIEEFKCKVDLITYKCFHELKMVILTRAKMNQVLRDREYPVEGLLGL